MRWHIKLTLPALKQLAAIKDTRVREGISRRIDALANDPNLQGKALSDELMGYRSIRAVAQRYRILYKLEKEQVIVVVVALGIRKAGDKRTCTNLQRSSHDWDCSTLILSSALRRA